MQAYHKINSPFKRDHDTNKLNPREFATPEIEYLAENEWVWTEKVDGTNIRIGLQEDGSLDIRGRTDKANVPKNLVSAIEEILDKEKMREQFPAAGDICLYGEGYGPKIQNGGKYRDTPSFVLFDVKVGHWWLRREDVESIAMQLNLDVVPLIMKGTLWDAILKVEEGLQSLWGDFAAEGLVGTPIVPMFDRAGGRVVTKVKTKDFPG